MASATKIALMVMLMSAMAMVAQAGTKNVTCENDYCRPLILNGVEVAVGDKVLLAIDADVPKIVCEVEDAVGKVLSATYDVPLGATSLVFSGSLTGLVVEVVGATLESVLGSITLLLSAVLDLIVCVL